MHGLLLALAAAQTITGPPIDPTALPSKADVAAVQQQAAAAAAAATAACKAAPAIPPSEMVGGTTGTTAAGCRPSDAAQPRITRAATVKTDSSGSYSVSWTVALAAAPVTLPIPVNATAEPVVCNVTTSTATGATGRCWYARTLPSTVAAVSALASYDLFGASAAGISVQVLAIPPTQ